MPTVDEIFAHFQRVFLNKRFHFGGYEWRVQALSKRQMPSQPALTGINYFAVLSDDTDQRNLRLDVGFSYFDYREQVWTQDEAVITAAIESSRWPIDQETSHLFFQDGKTFWLAPSGEKVPFGENDNRKPVLKNEAGEVIGTMAL